MKKIMSLILASVMLFSMSPVAFAIDFSDFDSSHWAYEYVNTLVNDGTINGYDDGTFRPTGIVTRAEFVKMLGNGPEVRENAFDDVAPNHWAYHYIMSSGLDAVEGNLFMPAVAITRGEVANLLWKRAGSPMGITAPPIIHRQGNNSDAISWVYTNGIMVGADHIDLRLGDTLTRAEAAALIVRSRSVSASTVKTNFMDSIDQGIFEAVYNAYKLTDRPYDANATVTNGELAMAAARLLCGFDFPTYPNVSATVSFEHKYAQPLNMLCRYYLGTENDNAAYADKNATVKDAIAALMFVTSRNSGVYIPQGTIETYPEIKTSVNEKYDQLLRRAYYNGIWFTKPDAVSPDKDVTMKELSCLALLFDGFSGFHNVTVINSEKTTQKNAKIRPDYASYPSNASDYRIILSSVSNAIYERSFNSAVSKPVDNYKMTNDFSGIFTSMLSTWVRALSSVGYELEVSYYPGIAVDNGNGYTMRVGIKFVNVPANTKLGDLINCVNAADGERLVNSGDVVYADIDTGKKVDGITLGIENMVLSQIIG